MSDNSTTVLLPGQPRPPIPDPYDAPIGINAGDSDPVSGTDGTANDNDPEIDVDQGTIAHGSFIDTSGTPDDGHSSSSLKPVVIVRPLFCGLYSFQVPDSATLCFRAWLPPSLFS
jgi:hypothetical protein